MPRKDILAITGLYWTEVANNCICNILHQMLPSLPFSLVSGCRFSSFLITNVIYNFRNCLIDIVNTNY